MIYMAIITGAKTTPRPLGVSYWAWCRMVWCCWLKVISYMSHDIPMMSPVTSLTMVHHHYLYYWSIPPNCDFGIVKSPTNWRHLIWFLEPPGCSYPNCNQKIVWDSWYLTGYIYVPAPLSYPHGEKLALQHLKVVLITRRTADSLQVATTKYEGDGVLLFETFWNQHAKRDGPTEIWTAAVRLRIDNAGDFLGYSSIFGPTTPGKKHTPNRRTLYSLGWWHCSMTKDGRFVPFPQGIWKLQIPTGRALDIWGHQRTEVLSLFVLLTCQLLFCHMVLDKIEWLLDRLPSMPSGSKLW